MGAGREQAQSTELPASPTRGVTPPILNVFARAPNNSFEYQISHTSRAESRVWLMKTASDESIGKQSIDHWQRTMMVCRRSGREGRAGAGAGAARTVLSRDAVSGAGRGRRYRADLGATSDGYVLIEPE